MKQLEYELVEAGLRAAEQERHELQAKWQTLLGEVSPNNLVSAITAFTRTQDTLQVVLLPGAPAAWGFGALCIPISGRTTCPVCGRILSDLTHDIAVSADGRIVCMDCLVNIAYDVRVELGDAELETRNDDADDEEDPALEYGLEEHPLPIPDDAPHTWSDLARLGGGDAQ